MRQEPGLGFAAIAVLAVLPIDPFGMVATIVDSVDNPFFLADFGAHARNNFSEDTLTKIDARTDASQKSFETVKDEVESKLQNERFEADSKVYLKKLWAEATVWVSPKYQARLSTAE